MPLTLTDEEVETLKKAFMYQLISHRAYFENNVLFRAMKDSGDFEKVVADPMKAILEKSGAWTAEDNAEKERVRKILLEKAQLGKTPEEWYKNAKKALDREFKITGKDIAVGVGITTLGIGAAVLGIKVIGAVLKGEKKKKKTGE